MKIYEKKNQNNSKSLMVTIPKEIGICLGLKKGDDVIINLDEKNKAIVIKKIEVKNENGRRKVQ